MGGGGGVTLEIGVAVVVFLYSNFNNALYHVCFEFGERFL